MSSRVAEISVRDKKLVTPTYFPAVSTAGVGYSAEGLIRLLLAAKYPRLLVSAYDTCIWRNENKSDLLSQLSNFSKCNSFLLLDSGVFEGYWRRDRTWTFESYANAIRQIESDLYFSFDILADPNVSEKSFIEETYRSVADSRVLSNRSECVPILHGADPEKVVALVRSFADLDQDKVCMIGVAERDCGATLIQRAGTVARIREVLNSKSENSILHILGCGNPTSLIVYSYCGADTFDSTDWSRYLLDVRSLKIGDIAHLRLLRCDCLMCRKEVGAPNERPLLHNLLFYQNLMVKIQDMIRDSTIASCLSDNLGEDILSEIEGRLT
jgi:queuine/archaeosine tRNA-ribosyltransferase